MPYAFVTKIKNIRKHCNADRLMIGECFGNSVIVGLTIEEGTLGVYFPTDTQLSMKYCEDNNLLRVKDENGKETGYIDPKKRNIRTLKLRKEISDGLFMPLSSLESFGNISKLKEGDTVDEFEGTELAKKYVPVVKHSQVQAGQGKRKKKEKQAKYPNFVTHVDTAQYAYNKSQFKKGDIVTVSLKMHGCFTYETRVKLWNNTKAKRISKIVVGDTVVGMGKDGKLVASKVTNILNNGKTTEWVKLSISRKGLAGEKLSKIECTPNHRFWSTDLNRYVEAEQLVAGQHISIVKKSINLSVTQKAILLGLSIGDGHYIQGSHGGHIEFSHKKEHEELVQHTLDSLGSIVKPNITEYKSGYGSLICRASTKNLPSISNYLNQYREVFPAEVGNKLKEAFVDEFSVLALAYLYMSDGSLGHHESQQDRAHIAICSFNDYDADIIRRAITKLGYPVVLYKDPKGYNRLRFNYRSASLLFNDITQYMPSIVRYKVSENYRAYPLTDVANDTPQGYDFIDSTVVSKENVSKHTGWTKYDIETETHNYVVGDVLVHNSSARTGRSIQQMCVNNPFSKLLCRMKLVAPYKQSYAVVSGSRRVTLTDSKGNHAGGDPFRATYHEFFDGKLKKGETVYYEIVGYTGNADQTIMAKCGNKKVQDKKFVKEFGETTVFSYGCEVGKNDIYVYRMSMTNEDGDVVEYPSSLVKQRCEEMAVKQVPLFKTFVIEDVSDVDAVVSEFIEGADPIGLSHIREGVIVRIENRSGFKAFKAKNTFFKIIEGIIKDEGILDAEELESM